MTELLKTLYWNLYTPHENQETEREMDDCHNQLVEVLGKPERKLVLRIIDGKDRLAEALKKTGYCGASLSFVWDGRTFYQL